ncbi:3-oxoacyl-[acyl-carrier-protein] reductase FabG [Chlamydiales bacterium SCGC AG-110-P3]|nr:3-oxoacyl-[acyl-carrier-protein] reductase FabG [Chlamydiales bacterium SCGC AG-110-P3]
MTEQQLQDQVALVTGGNAGIGKAIAKRLAAAGAKVVIFGNNIERGELVVEEIGADGGAAEFRQVDVADHATTIAAISTVVEKYGGLDILVNNAGITRDGLLLRMKESDWDAVLEVNLKSCFNTCKAVIKPMMKKRRGKIINITSVIGLTGNPGQVNYSASKAGMIGFCKSLAKEVASRNICINCIAPGYIETKMTGALSEQQREGIIQMIPLGRIGQPDDIAQAVLFLASSAADYITGQVLTVDGGMVC